MATDTERQVQTLTPPTEIVAAGVLPCAITSSGKIMFLLGQEGCARGVWIDSNTWDAFGGRRDLCKDQRPEDTAAREFFEETGGVVCDLEYMRQQLHEGCFLTHYDTLARGCNTKVYRIYVVRVAFREYPDQFTSLYRYLSYHNLQGKLEKKQIRWFSLDQVNESLRTAYPKVYAYSGGVAVVTPTNRFSKRILLRGHFARGLAQFLRATNMADLL